jgi:hypothetical protein
MSTEIFGWIASFTRYYWLYQGPFRQYVYSICGLGDEEKKRAPATRVREDGRVEVACASAPAARRRVAALTERSAYLFRRGLAKTEESSLFRSGFDLAKLSDRITASTRSSINASTSASERSVAIN